MTTEEKVQAYSEAIERTRKLLKNMEKEKALIEMLSNISKKDWKDIHTEKMIAWFEKQGSPVLPDSSNIGKDEQKIAKNIVETWKDMRLEVYQQASGNRHEPNYSDDTTKLFSLNDIDEIIKKMSEQKPADKVVPKFKAGDTIINIYHRCDGSDRIREINDGKYIFDDGSYITTREQDDWELVDKAELKFHIGDWIVNNISKDIFLIKSINSGYCSLEDTEGNIYSPCLPFESDFHLWTIQDARPSDVLVDEDNNIGIYERIEGLCWHSYIYLGCDNCLYGFSIGGSHEKNNTKPATKEQRDTLMKAMKDAEYTFDFESKELKRIEDEPENYKEQVMSEMTDLVKDYVKQKSAWSEEDKKKIDLLISILEVNHPNDYFKVNPTNTLNMEAMSTKELVEWLKSLKQRLGGEK